MKPITILCLTFVVFLGGLQVIVGQDFDKNVEAYERGVHTTTLNELKPTTAELAPTCENFPDHLELCTPHKCQFVHPFTGEIMVKAVVGEEAGNCIYTEEMPNGGQMDCTYPPELRATIAQHYRDVATAKTTGAEVQVTEDRIETTHTIDGKEVENPLQEAITSGQCIISGY